MIKSSPVPALRWLFPALLACLLFGIPGFAGDACLIPAQPVELSGLSNMFKVSETLYRGAQPSKEGFKSLEALGVKTVINLRITRGDEVDARETSMNLVGIPMFPWRPDEDDVIRFLRLTQTPGMTPVYLHCRHGSDRTGAMAACYRVVMCGWSLEQAIEEMKHGGFGYHSVWWTLPRDLEELDFDRIRHELSAD